MKEKSRGQLIIEVGWSFWNFQMSFFACVQIILILRFFLALQSHKVCLQEEQCFYTLFINFFVYNIETLFYRFVISQNFSLHFGAFQHFCTKIFRLLKILQFLQHFSITLSNLYLFQLFFLFFHNFPA